MNKFHLIEINNEPVSNLIALKKETDQNLICNRLSQFVPVQWLKVNSYFFTQSVMNKFHLIEINNEPVKNTIALEKGIAQNLTCNRFSEFVPVQWLKVNYL